MRTMSGATDAKKKKNDDDDDDVEKEDENNNTKIIIDLASRARTVLAAVRRLENDDEMQRKRRRLRVLVLGADRNEGATDDETEKIFKACGEEIPMDVSLVGPNVPKDDDDAVVWSSSSSSGRSAKEVRVAERERRLFHEKERGLTTKKEREREGRDEQQQQQQQQHDDTCEYDIAFAFNAGVWGYDSWTESLRRAVERYPKMPVVVTAYSMKECEMDEDCVREAFEEEEIRFVWEAEENKHHGEKVGGEENGRENSAWMCFVSNSGEKVGFRK